MTHPRRLTVGRFTRRPRTPLIRLHGDWLRALGFRPGDRVTVVGESGCLRVERLTVDALTTPHPQGIDP